MASDGKDKIKAILSTHFASEVHSGRLQNLGLLRILNYACNDVPNKPDK
jgi:replication factor A1